MLTQVKIITVKHFTFSLNRLLGYIYIYVSVQQIHKGSVEVGARSNPIGAGDRALDGP
jgi:hypothetical protein